ASSIRPRGRISTLREPAWARRKARSTEAGPPAGVCACSTNWWRRTTRSNEVRVTEVLFYHLQGQSIDRVLPTLLEKSLERGWRIVVQAASDERVDALDAHLWTYRDDGFLPHGTYRESEAAAQPVVLTVNDHNPNAAQVRFLIDGAPLPENPSTYQ